MRRKIKERKTIKKILKYNVLFFNPFYILGFLISLIINKKNNMNFKNRLQLMEDNVVAFFNCHKKIDYALLEKCLKCYRTAEKNKNRSFELSSKRDCTTKQRIRHELNCQDFEQKRMILDKCIEFLNI